MVKSMKPCDAVIMPAALSDFIPAQTKGKLDSSEPITIREGVLIFKIRDSNIIFAAVYIPPSNSLYFNDISFSNLDIIYEKFKHNRCFILGDRSLGESNDMKERDDDSGCSVSIMNFSSTEGL